MSTEPTSPTDDRAALVVPTTAGRVRGVRDVGVTVFRAIPYAAPPTFELRFAPPQPPAPWSGIRDCIDVGPSPPQGPSRLDAVMGIASFEQSEDCLSLTVWTPAADDRRRPVLYWLHGGAYQSGGGHQPFYDGANLARAGDLVVVSINYRLGALGYLHVPESKGHNIAPSSRGLLDQKLALQWVADNITAFGGDPDAITIAGQSAGGGSVLALLADPETRRLVKRAIPQSPSTGVLSPERAQTISARFYAVAGVRPGDMPALRSLPVSAILAAQRTVQMEIAATGDRSLPFQHMAPSDACRARPSDLLEQGAASSIPLLIGSTLDEGHAWLAQDDALLAATDFAAVDQVATAGGFASAASELPAERRAAAAKPWQLASAMMTWATFEEPARQLADGHFRHGGDAWVYRFDWRPTPDARFGACHCIELPFMLGNLDRWPSSSAMMAGHDPTSYQRLMSAMQGAWIAFIRTGSPATPSLPDWPRWSEASRPAMIFDDTCRVITEPQPRL